MKCRRKDSLQPAEQHFHLRAKKYDHSAGWVCDSALINRILEMARPTRKDRVLDIASGTGMIARAFHGQVRHITGVDISSSMTAPASEHVDELVICRAEEMPFDDNSFDLCVCRQGFQFMDLKQVFREMYRVLRPAGRAVLCHLTAYGEEDSRTAFIIQRLRNPARKNFFLPGDFPELMNRYGFTDIEYDQYISVESVGRWIDNGALDEHSMEKIKDLYRKAPRSFREKHNLVFKGGDILDAMNFCLVKGVKP